MRRFIRHPAAVPIQLHASSSRHLAQSRNLSEGGLCCAVAHALEVGSEVDISISLVKPPYRGHGVVVWCHPDGDAYEAGIRFEGEQDAFSVRMVEQVCQIELYRQTVAEHEGRQLSSEEAAAEWISLFAKDFPA